MNVDGKDCTLPATAVVSSAGNITKLRASAYKASANLTHFIKNLSIVRGEENISLSSDYESGSVITAEGIAVTSNIEMSAEALKDKVIVYDTDFDETAAGYTLDITYGGDRKSAVIKVTGLEPDGNYKLMIESVSDRLGISDSMPFEIAFKTAPSDEGGEEEPDDTPKDDPSESVVGGDEIVVDANGNQHGTQFTTVTKEDGVYTTVVDTQKW